VVELIFIACPRLRLHTASRVKTRGPSRPLLGLDDSSAKYYPSRLRLLFNKIVRAVVLPGRRPERLAYLKPTAPRRSQLNVNKRPRLLFLIGFVQVNLVPQSCSISSQHSNCVSHDDSNIMALQDPAIMSATHVTTEETA
jgi:hypothetical protein